MAAPLVPRVVAEVFQSSGPGLSSQSRVEEDFQNLIVRMRQRTYPGTVPALAYFWLRTLYVSGYDRGEWNQLDQFLGEALNETAAGFGYPEILAEIRSRIREDGLLTGDAPPPDAPVLTERTTPPAEVLVPYFVRLLNDWLPKEIARLMVDVTDDEGAPSLAAGRALERLLARQRLSRGSLEIALNPSLFSPMFVYPGHYEILRDAALFLLGRTAAPSASPGGACLLCTAPEARLFDDYAEAVESARIIANGPTELLEVPIALAQSKALFGGDEFRVASIVVTMDGRWWRAHTLRGGEQNAISYCAAGHLRIDFSGEQVMLRVPWLERRVSWSGATTFPKVELFGREWRTIEWDQGPEGTWLVLASTAPLPVAKLAPGGGACSLHQCRPAFVDIAWTALENALLLGSAEARSGAVEQLRRNEIIPLGRSLAALAETLGGRDRSPESIEGRLVAVAFHASALEPVYGKVPWRILPKRVRKGLLSNALYPVLADRLRAVFDGVPEIKRPPGFWGWLQHSPKRAA